MRKTALSLKWSGSIFSDLDQTFYPNQFKDIDSEIATRAASLMFGKDLTISMKNKGLPSKALLAFQENVDLISVFTKLEQGLSIEGGYWIYFDIDEKGDPKLSLSPVAIYNTKISDGFKVYERFGYQTNNSTGWLTVEKEYTPKTISYKFYKSSILSQEIDYINLGEEITVDEFNKFSQYMKYTKTTIKNPWKESWAIPVFNKPADLFIEASDTKKSEALNIALQRSLYFAVADQEKTQAVTYVLGDNDDFDIDEVHGRINRRNAVIRDNIEVINSDDENGKIITVPATPKTTTYLNDAQTYEEMIWTNSGYSYQGSKSQIFQTATEIKYFASGDVSTTDIKKQYREKSVNRIANKFFEYYCLANSLTKYEEIVIQINPNYSTDLEQIVKVASDKYAKGIISLPEMISEVKQISLSDAQREIKNNLDHLQARAQTGVLLTTMGVNKELINRFLFTDILDESEIVSLKIEDEFDGEE